MTAPDLPRGKEPEYDIKVRSRGFTAFGTVKLQRGHFWYEANGETAEFAEAELKNRLHYEWKRDLRVNRPRCSCPDAQCEEHGRARV